MTTLLSIQASPRGDRSISRALSDRFIEHWQHAHPDGRIVHRDLMATNLPYLNEDWISGVYAPPEVVRTPAMNAALDLSGELIAEVQSADHLLIGTPMYNFSVPAVLKSWIDYIVRPGMTFALAEGWPGLLDNKPTRLIIAARDQYAPGTPREQLDQVTPVMRTALAFMGIIDFESVLAGGSLGVNTGKITLQDHLAFNEEAIVQAARI